MSSLTPTEKRWHYRKASAKSSPEHEGRDGPLQPLREVTTSQSSWFTWHLPINQDRVFHKLGQSVGLEEQRDVKDHVAVACRNANTPPPPQRKTEQSYSHSQIPRAARALRPRPLQQSKRESSTAPRYSREESRACLPSSFAEGGNGFVPSFQRKKNPTKIQRKTKKQTLTWMISDQR